MVKHALCIIIVIYYASWQYKLKHKIAAEYKEMYTKYKHTQCIMLYV